MIDGETSWRDVTIAWVRSSARHGLTPSALDELGEGQLARYRELDGPRAAAFLAGRALIRDLVSRTDAGPLRLDSRCGRCGGRHAAPRAPGVALSVSHAADLVVVAASVGAREVGVDAELAGSASRVTELRDLFAPYGAPDLAGWTRIEAVVKADGRGFAIDPTAVRLHPLPWSGTVAEWAGTVPRDDRDDRDDPRDDPAVVATIAGPPGTVVSVARRGAPQT